MNKFVDKTQIIAVVRGKLNLLVFGFSTFIYIYFVLLNH
jgi:hypothetical protein